MDRQQQLLHDLQEAVRNTSSAIQSSVRQCLLIAVYSLRRNPACPFGVEM
jgi:hypothetical protein